VHGDIVTEDYLDTQTVKDLVPVLLAIGALLSAAVGIPMGIIAVVQIANAKRQRDLQPINQATTDEQLKYMGEKIAPVVGGWSATLNTLETVKDDLKQATTQIEQLRIELNESRSVRADLQSQATANRTAQTKLEADNDALREELRALKRENGDLKTRLHTIENENGDLNRKIVELQHQVDQLRGVNAEQANQIALLTAIEAHGKATIAALERTNDQLKLYNDQSSQTIHLLKFQRDGGHTDETRAEDTENRRKDAEAYAGTGSPVPAPPTDLATAPAVAPT
jgi:DNA repair exonuclease SbcCD ATPase subunit